MFYDHLLSGLFFKVNDTFNAIHLLKCRQFNSREGLFTNTIGNGTSLEYLSTELGKERMKDILIVVPFRYLGID